jgi:hypothetical protein
VVARWVGFVPVGLETVKVGLDLPGDGARLGEIASAVRIEEIIERYGGSARVLRRVLSA